jgi:hypothetical protein
MSGAEQILNVRRLAGRKMGSVSDDGALIRGKT